MHSFYFLSIKKTFVAQHKPQVWRNLVLYERLLTTRNAPPHHLGKHIRGFSNISSHPHWWTAGAFMATLEKAPFRHAESKLNALRILANISLEHMYLLLSHCSDQIHDKKQLWEGEFFFLAYFLSEYSPAWCTALWRLEAYGGCLSTS